MEFHPNTFIVRIDHTECMASETVHMYGMILEFHGHS